VTAGLQSGGLVRVRGAAAATGSVELEITVESGWYLFAPGSGDGLPVRVTSDGQDIPIRVEDIDGKLAGRFVLSLPGPVGREIHLHVQACNGAQCLRPSMLPVRLHAE
jgi:hypothetical protein